jgi:phosphotransferase system  glucose/maltose/N-acetylglucosamine-specific IIC component
MYWETLPSWVWVFYYLFLFLALGIGISNVIRKRMVGLSIIAIIFTITVPIISMLNSIGRAKGINEFEHLVTQLQQGSIWSIYAILGFLYIAVFLVKNKIHNRVSKSQ